MHRIQDAAFDLFDAHGYDAVTIERIAESAEVSASSVYRYFGTKEQLVLWNPHGSATLERITDELNRRPPLEAIHAAATLLLSATLAEASDSVLRRIRYAMEVPEIRSAFVARMNEIALLLADLLARKLRLERDDFTVHIVASATVGAVLGAVQHWYRTGFAYPLDEAMDSAFGLIRHLEVALAGRTVSP
ncbi:TetR family transcriptional regulator [Streptomyces sp. NPDC047315]|uniref:TetR/AcrR family transcriptional regulator n=1 Tax=Streptomyces sp. NPDC047315 TaxID=3155142 RepID=UPI0033EDBEF5